LLRMGMSALLKMPFNRGFLAVKNVPGMGEPFQMTDREFVQSLEGKKILKLEGFVFRADELFSKYADEIRKFFTLEEGLRERVQKFAESARALSDLLIGVHIRRGDYKNFHGGKFFFEVAQYANVMRAVKELFPGRKIRFLVCSNEKLPAETFAGLD